MGGGGLVDGKGLKRTMTHVPDISLIVIWGGAAIFAPKVVGNKENYRAEKRVVVAC